MAPTGGRTRRGHDVVPAAAIVAGILSGAPSTVHAVVSGRRLASAAEATRTAGEILGRPGLARGALAHAMVTAGWTTVLVAALPRRRAPWWGAAGGLAIAVVDLAIAERRFPAIAALPRLAQVADHVAFGALVGVVVARRDRRRSPATAG